MSAFVGLDPAAVRTAADRLDDAASRLDTAHDVARTALGTADITEPGLLRRLWDRSELLRAVAIELRHRATSIETARTELNSHVAHLKINDLATAGLASFDYQPRPQQVAREVVSTANPDIGHVDRILPEIRRLLHIDNQSGWTPWHDGDAEVTPLEAEEVIELLDSVDPITASDIVAQLDQTELERFANGLAGNATHADKPWGHWAWSPLQAPVRETRQWVGELGDAQAQYFTGVAEGFYAMGTNQGGPSQFNPYPNHEIEQHFANAGEIVLEGGIPILSNGARCLNGDGWSCVALGAEVALYVGGELVGGVIVGVVARRPTVSFVRVRLRDGTERVVAIFTRSSDEPVEAGAEELAEEAGQRAVAGVDDPSSTAVHALEGKRDIDVVDPSDSGRTITDIDRVEGGALWEEKSALDALDQEAWINKHIDGKFSRYLEARTHLPGYEDAPIGFSFTRGPMDPVFRAAVERAIEQLREANPNVVILARFSE